MVAPNLTRETAAQRSAILTVQNYLIELDLTDGTDAPGEETFSSKTTVTFTATAGASSFIDIVAARVHSAVLNGTALDVSDYDESTGISLPDLAADNELVIEADCIYSHTGEGLHRFVDPTDDAVYLYSQFETADAKRMFACFDQPDLKATFDVRVTAPTSWKVISNSAVVETLAADPGQHVFRTTPKMSTYLVALIAGPYAQWTDNYSDEHGDIPLGIFCRSSLAEFMDEERLFTETKQGFDFYHRNFGVPYAFGKYDQLFVPEFNAGAMENAGAVTFLEDYVFRSKVTRYSYERRAETVLHEMAHMWFGDLVTMAWWDDLWLNESFATFASVLCQTEATEYTNAWTTFANVEKSWAYRQDQLPSTHPIAADIPDLAAVEVNFDGITYAKGASVLKQLVAYVGLEPFLAGLREYFREHAFGNATFDDLLGSLEKSSGRDLSDWGRQWLKTTGLNILRPDFDVDADGKFTRFAVLQDGAAPAPGSVESTGSPSASTTTSTASWCEAIASNSTSMLWRAPMSPNLSASPAVHSCWSTTTISPTAPCDSIPNRWRPRSSESATSPSRSPHLGLVGGVGNDPSGRTEGTRLRRTGRARHQFGDRSRCGATSLAPGPDRHRLLRRPCLGRGRRRGELRQSVARTRTRGRGRVRPPAGIRQRTHRRRTLPVAHRGSARIARRRSLHRWARRPDRRHGSSLAHRRGTRSCR
ncbi:hypothetical protein GCM10020255_091820 [Rhodococcus baikonurensis]